MSKRQEVRIAVFASGAGTNFRRLCEAAQAGELSGGRIALLVSDQPGSGAVAYARESGYAVFTMTHREAGGRAAWEELALGALRAAGVDLVVLAGYMRLVGAGLLEPYAGRMINVHPSLLPQFPGLHAVRQALAAGVATTGVTVHQVDAGLDSGSVIVQESLPILAGDTEETLLRRLHAVEHRLLPQVVRSLCERVYGRKGVGMVKRALISVWDKNGLVDLARALVGAEVQLVSTGNTFKFLRDAGLPVTEVSTVTGFPEMMDGRVKTLHPLIHGGLLALRDNPEHMAAADRHGIGLVDYVVVNLYPFAATVARPDVTLEEAVENIDIGGPSMLRAAAKNHRFVTTIVDQADYEWIAERIRARQALTDDERLVLAAKVFRHTAAYDARVAEYLTEQTGEKYPETLTFSYELAQTLRYGENPHQTAAFYRTPHAQGVSLARAQQLQGKELSYNNIQDASAALQLIADFSEPAAVAVKHMNPCGVGVGVDAQQAWKRAYEADPVSIFGGIVAFNRAVDEEIAAELAGMFLEIVIAPAFSTSALERLGRKKNVRVLLLPEILEPVAHGWNLKSVAGGLLVQDEDRLTLPAGQWTVVTKTHPSDEDLEQLLFAWRVVKHVKSNAIVLARDGQTVGVGAGQMNRVGSARIAILQAGEKAQGAVLASDAYFPMPDTVEVAGQAGVRAIIQPGGSIKDEESIRMADSLGIAMVFTGIRHFKH